MKKIAFFVIGNTIVGTGHVYRVKILRTELARQGVHCDVYYAPGDVLVRDIFGRAGIETTGIDFSSVDHLDHDVFVLDILDTPKELVERLKRKGKVVTLEDLGEGSVVADLVINAMYPEKEIYPHHYYGHRYIEMREEFIDVSYEVRKEARSVLVTFGGTDPCNLTRKVLDVIYDQCMSRGIAIDVVAGLGYTRKDTLARFNNINFQQQVNNISSYMAKADIAFSSGGRTVYELACIGVPSIILCQNEREYSHFFASKENGFQQMGLGEKVETGELLKVFTDLVNSHETRKYMNELMKEHDLKSGTARVVKLISNLL